MNQFCQEYLFYKWFLSKSVNFKNYIRLFILFIKYNYVTIKTNGRTKMLSYAEK
jgi:hypothetical protein